MKAQNPDMKAIYRAMLRIRMCELRIEDHYFEDHMKTPVHLCIGQEAVAVGVCAALEREDVVFSNHRGHGHYLAKGGDLDAMIAELHCRTTGCAKGYGGSMHLIDLKAGLPGSSSIVGGGIPLAAGYGLALKFKQETPARVSVVFFGDGAADEGVLYECINFSMLKRLPVVFVYENNCYSVCSPLQVRQPGENFFHQAPRDLLWTDCVDGNDLEAVLRAAQQAAAHAKEGRGPAFLECKTYRMRGHAGAGSDEKLGYRPPGEMAEWEARCPVARFERRLLEDGRLTPEERNAMEKEIAAELDAAFDSALKAPLPEEVDALLHVYAE